ncbi:MAG: hypothetical protein ACREKH_06730 [Candidatus Rokuibacteriota bacterium]
MIDMKEEGGARWAAGIALAAVALVVLPIASPAAGGDRAELEEPAGLGGHGGCAPVAVAGAGGLDMNGNSERWGGAGTFCDGAPGSC